MTLTQNKNKKKKKKKKKKTCISTTNEFTCRGSTRFIINVYCNWVLVFSKRRLIRLNDFQLAFLHTKLLRKSGGCPKSKQHAPHPYLPGAHSYFLEQAYFQKRETEFIEITPMTVYQCLSKCVVAQDDQDIRYSHIL